MLGLNIDMSALRAALGIGYFVLVYGIGVLAMVFSISAFQFRHRKTIIIFNCMGQLSWVAYFVLQGDLTSAIACGLSAVMLAVFSKKEEWKWAVCKASVITFIILISGFSILSFKVWSDVFPLLAGVFAVIANSRATEKRLRQFSFLWCLSWMMNSILKFYPVAFANDLFCTVSTVVALIRYRNGKSDKKTL